MITAAEQFIAEACDRAPRGRMGECHDRALFLYKAWVGKAFNRAVDSYRRHKRAR